mmetsp:Transcript_79713/g.251985  ORF Transcript_79713/g.251985 Transcript_79713/m.251985 type:complete len:230 (+) Transcript_79713:368-1057(+)
MRLRRGAAGRGWGLHAAAPRRAGPEPGGRPRAGRHYCREGAPRLRRHQRRRRQGVVQHRHDSAAALRGHRGPRLEVGLPALSACNRAVGVAADGGGWRVHLRPQAVAARGRHSLRLEPCLCHGERLCQLPGVLPKRIVAPSLCGRLLCSSCCLTAVSVSQFCHTPFHFLLNGWVTSRAVAGYPLVSGNDGTLEAMYSSCAPRRLAATRASPTSTAARQPVRALEWHRAA